MDASFIKSCHVAEAHPGRLRMPNLPIVGTRHFEKFVSAGVQKLLTKMQLLSTMGDARHNSGRNYPCSTGGHPTSIERKRRLQMNKFRLTIKILAIATFMFAFASMAQAQATRT